MKNTMMKMKMMMSINEEYEKLEDFRKKIQDLYQIADLKEWADLEESKESGLTYNQNQYDYLQDLIKKM